MLNIFNIGYIITFLILLANFIDSKELLKDYYQKAEEILKDMSLDEKIGQIFLPFYNKSTNDEVLKNYHPAGFILYEDNLKNHTKDDFSNELKSLSSKSKIPLVYTIDEEGGSVVGLGHYFRDTPFDSPRNLYNKGGYDEIMKTENEKIKLLQEVGVAINFAPVADIANNKDDFMYERTLGLNPVETSKVINGIVNLYNEKIQTCCLKHFPGYGNNTSFKEGKVHDYRTLEYLQNNDLIPFKEAVKQNATMIMFSDVIYHAFDENNIAGLSEVVHNYLIKDLNFSGLIVLHVKDGLPPENILQDVPIIIQALKVGNNLIITSSIGQHIKLVKDSINKGEINNSLIENYAKKVLAWKIKYNIINPNENEGSVNVILIIIIFSVILLVIGIIIGVIVYFKKLTKNSDEKIDVENEKEDQEKRLIKPSIGEKQE